MSVLFLFTIAILNWVAMCNKLTTFVGLLENPRNWSWSCSWKLLHLNLSHVSRHSEFSGCFYLLRHVVSHTQIDTESWAWVLASKSLSLIRDLRKRLLCWGRCLGKKYQKGIKVEKQKKCYSVRTKSPQPTEYFFYKKRNWSSYKVFIR